MLYKDKKPTCVASLNSFPESFDDINWSYMQKVLKVYGFGRDICVDESLLSTPIFKNKTKKLVVNGNASTSFSIKRGCRQGDPISPSLFVMSAEVLACKIREDKTINGINLADTELKISRFVDDTSFFLKETQIPTKSFPQQWMDLREYQD